MVKLLKVKEEVFNKELAQWKKKEANLLKKLKKLEPKVDEEPEQSAGMKESKSK
jgi:hypothetical protein